jgi:hypothetical protein
MGNFAYLKNKSWSEITREERYFCAELFFQIKNIPQTFIQFLNSKFQQGFDDNKDWEIGYEVCFYRDYLFSIYKQVKFEYKNQKYPQKRTFDLCLFSDTDIIIIEAKADQDFSPRQMESIGKDEEFLLTLLKENGKVPRINIFLLCPSDNDQEFEGYKKFSWQDLYDLYKNPAFQFAERLPKRKKDFKNTIKLK